MPIVESQINGWFLSQKPSLHEMETYANQRRLPMNPRVNQELQRSSDFFGNTILTSVRNQELTLEGTTPSKISISPEGKTLISLNPGLVRRIDRGKIAAQRHCQQGNEGLVYTVMLDTKTGPEKYALKYTFPSQIKNGHYRFDAYTPGTLQQNILQAAKRESPVPNIHYAVPAIATLDMTLTPFVEDSIPVTTLINGLRNNVIDSDRQREDIFNYPQDVTSGFAKQVQAVLKKHSENLEAWVITKINTEEQFRSHHIKADGNPLLSNTVVELDTISDLLTSYTYLANFNSTNPDFIQQLLSGCHVVELIVGGINSTPQ